MFKKTMLDNAKWYDRKLSVSHAQLAGSDRMLQRDMFNKTMLDNAKWYIRKAVCLACTARGFCPRDVIAYHCLEVNSS